MRSWKKGFETHSACDVSLHEDGLEDWRGTAGNRCGSVLRCASVQNFKGLRKFVCNLRREGAYLRPLANHVIVEEGRDSMGIFRNWRVPGFEGSASLGSWYFRVHIIPHLKELAHDFGDSLELLLS